MCRRPRCRREVAEGADLCPFHEADRLWSLAVLQRDGHCVGREFRRDVACFGGLDAHHLIRRTYRATRWWPEIGITLCRGHHQWFHANRVVHDDFAYVLLGDRWLRWRRHAERNRRRPDMDEVLMDLRRRVA